MRLKAAPELPLVCPWSAPDLPLGSWYAPAVDNVLRRHLTTVCLYANDRSRIRKRPFAYTQKQTYIFYVVFLPVLRIHAVTDWPMRCLKTWLKVL